MLTERVPVDLVTTETSDGLRLHGALSVPPGAREAVLGVHGAWSNFYASPVTAFLRAAPARGLAALVMNGRGHDLGGLDDGARSVGLIRERLEDAPLDLDASVEVLHSCGMERVLVVAHSYGCARAAYWLGREGPEACVGAALLSPPPAIASVASLFVDGDIEEHFDAARRAMAADEPHRMIVLREGGHIPVIAEAATVLSIWAPESSAETHHHVGDVQIPVLVISGDREADPYRLQARRVVENGVDTELLTVDDDHFHRHDLDATAESILDWAEARSLISAGGAA